MGKLIIAKEEIKSIRGMYGLNEQTESISVSIVGEQPYPNGTDWDSVHGILGSKKISDDLEERVGEKLKQGSYRITDVKVSSYLKGNKIITDGAVTLVSDTNNPDIAFTTRGSIGDNYVQRHDNQVNGLVDRLSNYYKGTARQFGPFIIEVKGTKFKYKQSFFAISKNSNPSKTTGEATLEKFKTWIKTNWVDSTTKKSQLTGNEMYTKEGNIYVVYVKGKGKYKYRYDGITFTYVTPE
jgi:hypothetical protein